MLSYAKCAELFATARNPHAGKPIGSNTRIHQSGADYIVVLYSTEIVRFRPDGSVVLNSGTYLSSTVKRRMKEISGLKVSTAGIWHVCMPDGGWTAYFDGWSTDPEERAMHKACRPDGRTGRLVFEDWLRDKGREPVAYGFGG